MEPLIRGVHPLLRCPYLVPGYLVHVFRCQEERPRGGGFSLTNGIRGCSKVLRCIFVSFGISMGGLSSHTQCAQFAKLGVFWKI